MTDVSYLKLGTDGNFFLSFFFLQINVSVGINPPLLSGKIWCQELSRKSTKWGKRMDKLLPIKYFFISNASICSLKENKTWKGVFICSFVCRWAIFQGESGQQFAGFPFLCSCRHAIASHVNLFKEDEVNSVGKHELHLEICSLVCNVQPYVDGRVQN